MKALVFRQNIPRIAVTKAASLLSRRAYVAGSAPIRMEVVPEPFTGDGWVTCDTQLAGICGSDAKQVFLHGSLDNPMTALISLPHILGHEALARRRDTGELVVLDPWLPCRTRGIEELCVACRNGDTSHCRNFTHGAFARGIHLGNCADRGGVHAESFSAHESQLHAVPAGVTPHQAVLADPVSVSLRHVLRTPPDPNRPALVYGCGTLGLAAVALLRHLHPDLEIWAVSKHDVGADLAKKFGADEVFGPAPDALVDSVAALCHAEPLTAWSRKRWLLDGPGVVYDTVGKPKTVETALRLVGVEGAIAISGVEAPKRFEWTPLYFKEISVRGSNAFGFETRDGVHKHAFEHYFDLLAEGFDVSAIVTHEVAFANWQGAYSLLADKAASGAVKVLFRFT
ncbi:MAG: zinc-binding dehydrogenase [Acidimicrobiia bacterium]|nr:zinc-binding dehydrogenase [Acidimicrobiia bacterium]